MTHNYTFYYSSQEYKDGWERIFGNAKSKSNQESPVKRTRRSGKGDTHQKTQRRAGSKRRSQSGNDLSSQEPGRDSSPTA
jgi:hypothetical protein